VPDETGVRRFGSDRDFDLCPPRPAASAASGALDVHSTAIVPPLVGCSGWLAAHATCRTCGANGDEIIVFNRTDVVRLQRDERLRSTGSGDEFDRDGIGAVDLNNRAEVSAAQAVSGYVMSEDDNVEGMNGHWASPG
jgi:hypothetical protein